VTDFDRLMAVNLRGLFLCLKYELKAMADNTGCAIVNLASTTSSRPGRLQPAYTASKFGVAGLTKQAAIDYADAGVRINAIAPGNIDTPMLRSALDRRGIDGDVVQGHMPMGRFGTAQEIAQAALWLCSSASSFTTGHVLAVEGGMLVG
ncbi:MAG: SDR family NAD(P)-dependent oxidoreductase, partial [Pseudomonadales bacterium]